MFKPSQKFLNWLKKECDKREIDIATIDIEAEFDSSLSLNENKQHFIGILNTISSDLESAYKKAIAENEKYMQKENERIQEQIKKYNIECLKCSKSLEQYYSRLIRAVKMVLSGKIHCAFVKSKAGMGKTLWINKTLEKVGADWVKFSGKITDAKLYEFLYNNQNKIIWFDDVGKLLRGLESLDMLKIVTDDKKIRVLSKANYSKQQEHLPDRFEFNGGIIFSFNSLIKGDNWEDLEALFSRGIFVEMVFSFEDICDIMRTIATTEWQKEVTEFLIKNYSLGSFNNFNLRLQSLCFSIYEYAEEKGLNWKKEIAEEIKNQMSEVQRLFYSYAGEKWVKRSDFVKYLVKTKGFSKRTAERRVNEWIELEEIFTDGREKFQMIGLKPISLEV